LLLTSGIKTVNIQSGKGPRRGKAEEVVKADITRPNMRPHIETSLTILLDCPLEYKERQTTIKFSKETDWARALLSSSNQIMSSQRRAFHVLHTPILRHAVTSYCHRQTGHQSKS